MVKKRKRIGATYGVVFAVLLFFSILPLFHGITHIGVWCLFGITATVGVNGLCYHRPDLIQGNFLKAIKKYNQWLLILIIIFEVIFSFFMIKSAYFTPPDNKEETAIVLGCLVIDDKPSLMLQKRLKKALLYLEENPESIAIVTGGTGTQSIYSEALVQQNWLVSHGIAQNRIIIEDKSHDTHSNIENAANLIIANDLPTDVVIFTDGFHQLRSQIFANNIGLSPTSVSASTPWGLFLSYWVREQLAIIQAIMIVIW